MHIIIMRHAEATFKGADRVLTQQGFEQAASTGFKLGALFSLHRIYVSPKTRAQQTLSAVLSKLKGRLPKPEILPELSPSGDAGLVLDYIRAQAQSYENILLISHIPLVENLCLELCPLEIAPNFGNAYALVLKVEGDKALRERLITPTQEIVF